MTNLLSEPVASTKRVRPLTPEGAPVEEVDAWSLDTARASDHFPVWTELA